ncbi:kinase-like domain-containing protein [Panaeolus papilionaceus]|nr:kinase-like domain-containing protein [Panaeolus papilionaceus]
MEFDFLSYLHTFLGPDHVDSEQITIVKLTGGFTNFTARASFRTPLSLSLITKESAHDSKRLTSVVLKYAPLHMAIDPSQALSVRRQDVEAAALQVLGPLLPGTNVGSGQNGENMGRYHTPSLYLHDKENNILWMEDLGADAKPLIQVLRASSPPLTQDEVKEMGVGLGQVVHYLQKVTSAWVGIPPANLVDFQTSASEEIHTYLSQLTFNELTKGGMEETEAQEISGIVLKGLQELRDEEPFWGTGDFWPENVLVYREKDTGQLKFGLIDWEYFGPSSVPAEIGMFCASSFRRL